MEKYASEIAIESLTDRILTDSEESFGLRKL